ncbi:hypothetical protein D3C85_1643460 [compost metagenome]
MYGEKLICQIVPSDTVAMKPDRLNAPRLKKSAGSSWTNIMMKPASSAEPITQVPMRLRMWMKR